MRRLPLAVRFHVVEAGKALAEASALGLHAVEEAVEERRSQAEQEGHVIPCKVGCAGCCSVPVLLSLTETWAIVVALRTWPDAALRRLRRRLRDAYERERGVTTKLPKAQNPDPPRAEAYAREYMRAGIVCPLLVDERCSVYGSRPIGCAAHTLVDADPRACSDGSVPTLRRLDMSDAPDLAGSAVSAAIDARAWQVLLHALHETWPDPFSIVTALRLAWPAVAAPEMTLGTWIAGVRSRR